MASPATGHWELQPRSQRTGSWQLCSRGKRGTSGQNLALLGWDLESADPPLCFKSATWSCRVSSVLQRSLGISRSLLLVTGIASGNAVGAGDPTFKSCLPGMSLGYVMCIAFFPAGQDPFREG